MNHTCNNNVLIAIIAQKLALSLTNDEKCELIQSLKLLITNLEYCKNEKSQVTNIKQKT